MRSMEERLEEERKKGKKDTTKAKKRYDEKGSGEERI